MDWIRYVGEAKRVELTDAQYRAAKERMEADDFSLTKQFFYTISNAGGGGSTLAKLRKQIFAGAKAPIYDFERGTVNLGKTDKGFISVVMDSDHGRRVLHAASGLAEEALEVVALLPSLMMGRPGAASGGKLAMELGDVVWFLAILCDALDMPLPALCAGNVAKLRVRYPDGFDSERSKTRDLDLEAAAFSQAMEICMREGMDREAGDWTGSDVVAKDAEIARLLKRIKELERSESQLIDERDHAQKAANALAYTIAPVEVIGEHSNMNDPWTEALEALDNERARHEGRHAALKQEMEAVKAEKEMADVEIQHLEAKLQEYEQRGQDEIGASIPPARYNKEGRHECLDEIRMALGYKGFQSWLIGTIIKYAYRSGAKPGDIEKEQFYRQLLQHVVGAGVQDPRVSREGWAPRKWDDACDAGDWRDQQDLILQQYFAGLR